MLFSVRERWSAGNHDRAALARMRVTLRGELGVEIFPHVDRARDRIAGNIACESKDDRIARTARGRRAAHLHLIPLDRAVEVPHRKISLVRALNVIPILLDEQRVMALAAEELDRDIPPA